jgi:hypothetical protein
MIDEWQIENDLEGRIRCLFEGPRKYLKTSFRTIGVPVEIRTTHLRNMNPEYQRYVFLLGNSNVIGNNFIYGGESVNSLQMEIKQL